MALVKCVECGAMISDKAKMCPSCGIAKEDVAKNYYGILNIHRDSAMAMCLAKVDICIDGVHKGRLENGGYLKVSMEAGTHYLSFGNTGAGLAGFATFVNPVLGVAAMMANHNNNNNGCRFEIEPNGVTDIDIVCKMSGGIEINKVNKRQEIKYVAKRTQNAIGAQDAEKSQAYSNASVDSKNVDVAKLNMSELKSLLTSIGNEVDIKGDKIAITTKTGTTAYAYSIDDFRSIAKRVINTP